MLTKIGVIMFNFWCVYQSLFWLVQLDFIDVCTHPTLSFLPQRSYFSDNIQTVTKPLTTFPPFDSVNPTAQKHPDCLVHHSLCPKKKKQFSVKRKVTSILEDPTRKQTEKVGEKYGISRTTLYTTTFCRVLEREREPKVSESEREKPDR